MSSDDLLIRIRDVRELARTRSRIDALARKGKPHDRLEARAAALLSESAAMVEARRGRVPDIRVPAELPVHGHTEEIIDAMRSHRVVVVAGETGSGKTTQLPKLALAAGFGVQAQIGHTQPRRIAARNVARRMAEEVAGANVVGFQTRFEAENTDDALIKVMTDGILLAETRHDPDLLHYDCLIIDEAHERSLNIDFLLGYLHRLLQRRDDLTVVITSATIDVERFAAHFSHFGPVPIIEVSGRTHPVDVQWLGEQFQVAEGAESADQIADALEHIALLERGGAGVAGTARDVLVFLPGEREIRDAARALRERAPLPSLEVLPLYARLSRSDQQRVFQPGTARRVVLATNVAETSLTVPRIGYVIDTGLARISRYSYRSKLQRLPVEPISQASAAQRAGRCGRIAPGICLRLYSQEDFESRDAFTEPEILRTNLASVVLQMADLGLDEPEEFPFMQPPEPRALGDGRRLLVELGALDAKSRLTEIGRTLSALPLDPRLARMVHAARERGALREVLIIVAAMTAGDIRERPADRREASEQAHREWSVAGSDFLVWPKLWDWLEKRRAETSSSTLRKECRRRFLSWLRLLEWRSVHRQLLVQIRRLGWTVDQNSSAPEAVHRALLPGLLSLLGQKTERGDYVGARGQHFHLFPGSALFSKPPAWVMSAEIVETSRVYARVNASIDPAWVEEEAQHLVRRRHEGAIWHRRRGQVLTREFVTLYGLPIVEGRQVPLDRIDPASARRTFLLEALVRGGLGSKAPFLEHNQRVLQEVEEMEARQRARDLLVAEERLLEWFEARVPADVVGARAFERWRRKAERENPQLLHLDIASVMQRDSPDGLEGFPTSLAMGEHEFALGYAFAPGREDDGVTLRVPLAALLQVDARRIEWLVPGRLAEKCDAMLRGLPKRIRRHLAPVPDKVAELMPLLVAPETFARGSLRATLTRLLRERFGVDVPADSWAEDPGAPHLAMRIEVRDADGSVLAAGRDLAALRQRFAPEVASALDAVADRSGLEMTGARRWEFGTLEERVSLADGVVAWPGLVDEGSSVGLRMFPSAGQARSNHRAGCVRLLLLGHGRNLKLLQRDVRDRLQLLAMQTGDPEALIDSISARAVARAHQVDDAIPRDAEAFDTCLREGRVDLAHEHRALGELVAEILQGVRALRSALGEADSPAYRDAVEDVESWLSRAVPADFVASVPDPWIAQLPRYLRAGVHRLQHLQGAVERDRAHIVDLQEWQARLIDLFSLAGPEPSAEESVALSRCRWLLEEYRVSLMAQSLGTLETISAKRLRREFDAVDRQLRLSDPPSA